MNKVKKKNEIKRQKVYMNCKSGLIANNFCFSIFSISMELFKRERVGK